MKTFTKHCESCNTEFLAKRFDAKFCSGACKQQAYLERIMIQNEQLEVNKFREQTELSDQLVRLTKEFEELKKVRETQQNQAVAETYKLMNETFKKYENEAIKEKIDNANKALKGWLQQLLEFNGQEGTAIYKIKSLFEDIIRSGSCVFYNLPNDYKYLPFITNTLIPKVKKWYDEIKYSRERYINLGLPQEAMRKFTDILYEID